MRLGVWYCLTVGDFIKLSNSVEEYKGYVVTISSNKKDLVLRTENGNIFIENYRNYSCELLDYYHEYEKRNQHTFSLSKPKLVIVDCIRSLYDGSMRINKDTFKIVIDADIIQSHTLEYIKRFSFVVACYIMESDFGRRYIKTGSEMDSILPLWDVLNISVIHKDIIETTFNGMYYVNKKGVIRKDNVYSKGTSIEKVKESMRY